MTLNFKKDKTDVIVFEPTLLLFNQIFNSYDLFVKKRKKKKRLLKLARL